jgi:RHS repeat-associated protein
VHVDQLNRPVQMTDAAKAVVWSAVYSPFGGAYTFTGSETLNTRFPGQWFQLEAGLHYNWHRHYDPSLGRYTQPDPLGFVDGPSVYAYARSSPHRYVDKDGRNAAVAGCFTSPAGMLICGGAAAATAIIVYMCTPSDKPKKKRKSKEEKRCEQVRKECQDKCTDLFPTSRSDQGMPFYRCLNQCLFDNNCGGTDYSKD